MRWRGRDRSDPREPAIVAFGPNDAFLGAGVYNGKGRVLTCGHVVADALGVKRATDLTGEIVSVRFPFLPDEGPIDAVVVQWRSLEDGDFAGLELSRIPRGARPGRLLELAGSLEGKEASTFGYPNDFSKDGIWASVVIKRNQANGLTQVEGRGSQFEIEPGFSGSPVWLTPDHRTDRTPAWLARDDAVMGLVRRDDATNTAGFVIPASTIAKWWPGCSTIRLRGRWGDRLLRYLWYAAVGVVATIVVLFGLYAYAKGAYAADTDQIDAYLTRIAAGGSARPRHLHDLSQLVPRFGLESHAISGLMMIVRQEHARTGACLARTPTDAAVRALDSLFNVVRALQQNAATHRRVPSRVLEGLLGFTSDAATRPTVRSLARTDLSGATLDSISLTSTDLEGACLVATQFVAATLDSAIFTADTLDAASFVDASVRGAHFRNAFLRGADLSRAKLQGADFVGANLSCAQLGNANVSGAEFEYATATWAYFGQTTLSGASNWDAIVSLASANFEWPVDSAAIELEIAKSKGAVMTVPLKEWTESKNAQLKPGGACM